MTDTLTTQGLAALARALVACRSLEGLDALVRGPLARLLGADELLVDIDSHDLRRPPLIRVNVDDAWARRYNDDLHRLNPASSTLRRLLRDAPLVVRRFEDLCPEPLTETRFFREYMAPQRHRHSLIGALALAEAGNLSPTMTVLVVRYDGAAAFDDTVVAALELLMPAAGWGIHCAMRASDTWAASVVRAVFALPPRQAEVALLVTKGLSNQEIADRLAITLGTAKHYVHQVLESTGASSRADLCRLILG